MRLESGAGAAMPSRRGAGRLMIVLVAAVLVVTAIPAFAEERKHSWEVGVFAGYTKFGNETQVDNDSDFGLRVGWTGPPYEIGCSTTSRAVHVQGTGAPSSPTTPSSSAQDRSSPRPRTPSGSSSTRATSAAASSRTWRSAPAISRWATGEADRRGGRDHRGPFLHRRRRTIPAAAHTRSAPSSKTLRRQPDLFQLPFERRHLGVWRRLPPTATATGSRPATGAPTRRARGRQARRLPWDLTATA